MDYRPHMRVDFNQIGGPLLFRFIGTVAQLRDYLSWAREQQKRAFKKAQESRIYYNQ